MSASRLVRVTRVDPETINLPRLCEAIERARGRTSGELRKVADLVRRRIADLDNAERIDAAIDRLGIPDVDDLIEVLPMPGALAWVILTSTLMAEEADNEEGFTPTHNETAGTEEATNA